MPKARTPLREMSGAPCSSYSAFDIHISLCVAIDPSIDAPFQTPRPTKRPR